MFARFLARDANSNGRFLVGVKTTGIFCLPSCPARKPKPENTLFFEREQEALDAGLRACKRCRPDHFYRKFDPDLEALESLVRAIRKDPSAFPNVSALVEASGIGKTKLSAAFREHFHESPASVLARARVDAVALRIATENGKPLELAFELGFESSSSFHDNFAKQLAVRPGDYRKLTRGKAFRIKLPANFNRARTLKLLGRDGGSVNEQLESGRFSKAVRLDGASALLRIDASGSALTCEVDSARAISPLGMAEAHRIALRMFGLISDPEPLERLVRRGKGLSRLTKGREGLRVLLTADVFESLIWSIIGQQVNLPFAMAMRARLIELTAPRRAPTALAGLIPHPTAAAIAKLDYDDLRPLQFSRRKAEYVIDTSRAVASGELDLDELAVSSATEVSKALLNLRGIGPWSANYVMMRGIGFADSLPVGDSGLMASLKSFFDLKERPNPEETEQLMKPFRPYRSLACLHLWQRLND